MNKAMYTFCIIAGTFLVYACSRLDPIPVPANSNYIDISMRVLNAQNENRYNLVEDIHEYQDRRVEFLRKASVRNELRNRYEILPSFFNATDNFAELTTLKDQVLNDFFISFMHFELGDTRKNQLQNTQPNSPERANLLSEYVFEYGIYKRQFPIRSEGEQTALNTFVAQSALYLLPVDFDSVSDTPIHPRYNIGTILELGKEFLEYNNIVEVIADDAIELQDNFVYSIDTRNENAFMLQEQLMNEFVTVEVARPINNNGLFTLQQIRRFDQLSQNKQLELLNNASFLPSLTDDQRDNLLSYVKIAENTNSIVTQISKGDALIRRVLGILIETGILSERDRMVAEVIIERSQKISIDTNRLSVSIENDSAIEISSIVTDILVNNNALISSNAEIMMDILNAAQNIRDGEFNEAQESVLSLLVNTETLSANEADRLRLALSVAGNIASDDFESAGNVILNALRNTETGREVQSISEIVTTIENFAKNEDSNLLQSSQKMAGLFAELGLIDRGAVVEFTRVINTGKNFADSVSNIAADFESENYASAASGAVSVLSSLKTIDPEYVKGARNIINAVISGVSIVTGINIIFPIRVIRNLDRIFSGASGFLIGGDSDPEVLEAIRRIEERLVVIEEKVDKVISLQMETLNAVRNLEKTIIQRFDTLNEYIQDLKWNLSEILASTRGEKFKTCEVLTNNRISGFAPIQSQIDDNFPIVIGRHSSLESMINYFNTNRDRFTDCFNRLLEVFGNSQIIFNEFRMSAYTDNNESLLTNFIHPAYIPLMYIFESNWPILPERSLRDTLQELENKGEYRNINTNTTDSEEYYYNYGRGMEVFCLLINSSLSYQDISVRRSGIDSLCEINVDNLGTTINPLQSISSNYNGFIEDAVPLIHPNALQLYVYLLLEILPYYNLELTSNGELNRNIENNIEISLQNAYRLVNIAIAQQTLITGDILLPVIHNEIRPILNGTRSVESLMECEDTNDSYSRECLPVFAEMVLTHPAHKELLTKNYLIMQFSQDLSRRLNNESDTQRTFFEQNLDIYEEIYICNQEENDNCGNYENILASYWNFETEGVNTVRIGNTEINMPTPSELENLTYHAPQEYYNLLRLRDRVIDYAMQSNLNFVLKVSNDPTDTLRVIDNNGNYAYY